VAFPRSARSPRPFRPVYAPPTPISPLLVLEDLQWSDPDTLASRSTAIIAAVSQASLITKFLRYWLLHVAARLTRGQRRLWLRIDQR
jgi:hypothetical protein